MGSLVRFVLRTAIKRKLNKKSTQYLCKTKTKKIMKLCLYFVLAVFQLLAVAAAVVVEEEQVASEEETHPGGGLLHRFLRDPYIEYRGNNGKPSSAFPLGRCEGDCDSDRDCDHGLKCFQRGPGKSVPGCRGGSSDHSYTDYW